MGNNVEGNLINSSDSAPEDELNELLDEMREAQKSNSEDNEETECFRKLLKDAQCELYPGCKMSLLSVIVKLLHLKVLGKWSNKSFNMLLEFLKDILPVGETLPASLYGARKLLVEIGLGYEEIDVCKNDCALFWKENEKADICPICKESRWETKNSKNKFVPHKKMRYFPIKPRLQRLFMSRKTTFKMRWHKERCLDEEGSLRHPADSLAWKHVDKQFPHFSKDPRNVRLGLASDGFTPWSNLGNSYSMWPVILSVYNLPPYDCMRAPFLMMSLLIPGPIYPGKDIDVYMQPLIQDLKDLWNIGIETYDIYSKEKFQMHVVLLWTISDLPGYSLLSGWVTMGHYACPCCLDQTDSKQLRTKTCYMGHRRFLHQKHSFRKNKCDFNGEEERRPRPRQVSGDDILRWLNSLHHVFSVPSKHKSSNKKRCGSDQVNWVKKSIFFELPYWHNLLIRHNLDVMHIEKNICDNVLGTLLDIKANISKCVKENKIAGLKSHDSHVLLQRLIPAGIRGYLTKEVNEVLFKLGDFFKELCSKTLKEPDIERLGKNIPLILCKLEKIYPPYFFTLMVHLTVHLAEETKIAGPMQFRWMYPIERFLGTLKGYARNKARPEGSIAEGYIVNESLTFLSMYLPTIETRFNRPNRNYDGANEQRNAKLSVFSMRTLPFGHVKSKSLLSEEELSKAHWFILSNCEEVEPYLKIHKGETKGIGLDEITDVEEDDDRQKDSFPQWFTKHIGLQHQMSENSSDELWALANGPMRLNTICYSGCLVNEVRFHTRDRDALRRTQNSGLVVEGIHKNKSIEFFGFLKRVVELTYIGGYKVILFQCEWFDMGSKKTIQVDKHFTSVDIRTRWYKDDPFVLPTQVQQVFYINDTKLGKNWQIVQRVQHRHLWDLPELEVENVVSTTDLEVQDNMTEMSSATKFKKVRKAQGLDRVDCAKKTTTNGRMSTSSMQTTINRSASKSNASANVNPPASALQVSSRSGSTSGNGSTSSTSALNPNSEGLMSPTNNTPPHTEAIPDCEASEPNFEASTAIPGPIVKRSGRGVSRGLNLDKIVKQSGKMKIVFNPHEKIPSQNEENFSEGIGIAVRTCAELEGVSRWRQIQETNKEVCRRRLLQWFEIEEWNSDRVQRIVDQMFQTAYRHWRNRLSGCYKNLVEEGKNPRDMSPREEVPIAKWHAVCDWLESDEYEERSLININSRRCLPFNHTSGKIRYLSRYRKMATPSKIELWRKTHVDKAGQFVNSEAAKKFGKMMELEETSMDEGETSMSEDQILVTTLGRRSGYQKVMGYGVDVSRGYKYSSNAQQESEIELQNAKSMISTLTTELAEQKEKNKSYEGKIENLEVQMQQMRQFFLQMHGTNTSQASNDQSM